MVLIMGYYEITKQLCTKNGIKIAQLEKALEFGNGTIGKWKTSVPKSDKLQKVADYFHVSISAFGIDENGKKKDPPTYGGLSDEEKELIDVFRLIPVENQSNVLDLLKDAANLFADRESKSDKS